MAKKLMTAEELVALLNAELRKHEFCEGVTVTEVVRVNDDRLNFTWTALIRQGSGIPDFGDCTRFFHAALQLFQQQYDLVPDE
jgi:hypothetical protein